MPPKFSSNSPAGRLVYFIILPVPLLFIVNLYHWIDNHIWVLMVFILYFLLSGLYLYFNCLDWDLHIDPAKHRIVLQRFSQHTELTPENIEIHPIPLATQLFGAFRLRQGERAFVFKYKPVHYLFFKNVKSVTEELERDMKKMLEEN